ncbi:MAG: ATP-binding protein [gamma proteobacterium symbiont of Ctena orbiculata]|uniref:AAA family ATPase n=1 Tax=Candidatus Thiodiazotropha taylori TaxID=2792791 RepID=A0A944QW52_9GAMM|nr:AAA family ATPase [Candidatus Thiodiazotropha taylori]PUB90096.1 MAG: ATP-binding protein [gamma proteobacterium symbiont of Ctena orbiculata]MBT2990740.1 AAA family ATPase [Candidatus Thiodiazotropha taylori]MBT2996639.1 AAA family ATPase [Candidatus Thiodiazotropha taylori]MBT3000679.1 AAA family ATPase [Candidatus Thiodiazotropha taylori]
MINTLAIANYRSLLNLVIPLGSLNVVTGANASGKSNLYRSLRLLAETAQGGVINALAKEGGLESTFWAGPENISRRMKQGSVPVQGGPKQARTRLRLGFCTDEFGYSISLGLPTPSASAFALDPEVKRECIWAGNAYRPASQLVDRTGGVIKIREERQWEVISQHASSFDSLFGQIADPVRTPEVVTLRDNIRGWRFYDHFRTDGDAPARQPQLGTRTPVLHHDGRDLAAALQTIREIGDAQALDEAIGDAFPGSELAINIREDGRFFVALSQYGLLRPLSGFELSDGTLRYLLWVAALLTPRPPPLMVLNEPETSLHPDLLPALARLIIKASQQTQVWVVSHATRLIAALEKADSCHSLGLDKELGQTIVRDQGLLDEPSWHWPDLKK